MFLIFGTQGIKRKSQDEPILNGMCPNCGSGDLEPKIYRNWFTLFFIPVFPISSTKLIYECNQCQASYDERIKEHIHKTLAPSTKEESLNLELYYSRALIASVTYLIHVEPSVSSKGIYLINQLIYRFRDLTEELEALKKSIVSQGNTENQVFEYLYEAKDQLSKKQLWELFIQIGIFFTKMKTISVKQESIIREFLIATGFPSNKFSEIMKNGKI